MRSGTKNCYVAIERNTPTVDPTTNASVPAWAVWKNLWCNAMARRGREVEIGGQVVAESYMRFDFDYLDVVGITELDVIVYEGVRYAIKGLLPDIALKDNYTIDAVSTPPGTYRA